MAGFGVSPSAGRPVCGGAGSDVPGCWAGAAAGGLTPVGVLGVSSVRGVPLLLLAAGVACEVGAWPGLPHRPMQNCSDVAVNAFGEMSPSTELLHQLGQLGLGRGHQSTEGLEC